MEVSAHQNLSMDLVNAPFKGTNDISPLVLMFLNSNNGVL